MLSQDLLSFIEGCIKSVSLDRKRLGELVLAFAMNESLTCKSGTIVSCDAVMQTNEQDWITFLGFCHIVPVDSKGAIRTLPHIAQARLILDSMLCLATISGYIQTDVKYSTKDSADLARIICEKSGVSVVCSSFNDIQNEEVYLAEIKKLTFSLDYIDTLEKIISCIEKFDKNAIHFNRNMFNHVYYDGSIGKGFTFSKRPTPHITDEELLKILYLEVVEGYFAWSEKKFNCCVNMMRIRRHMETLDSLTVHIPKEFMKVCPNHNTYLQEVYSRLFRQGYGSTKESIINLLKFVGVAYKEGI